MSKHGSAAGFRGIHIGGPPSGRGTSHTGGKAPSLSATCHNPGGGGAILGKGAHKANIGTREPHRATNTGPKGSN